MCFMLARLAYIARLSQICRSNLRDSRGFGRRNLPGKGWHVAVFAIADHREEKHRPLEDEMQYQDSTKASSSRRKMSASC